jgi:hypothetical protein
MTLQISGQQDLLVENFRNLWWKDFGYSVSYPVLCVSTAVIMPRSFLIKKNNYSNCPLKKRPVTLYKEPQEEEDKGRQTTWHGA